MSVSIEHSTDQLAELRAEIAELRALVRATPQAKVRRAWRRPAALVGITVLTVATLAGVAGASGSTTAVTFVPLSPAKALLTNTAIATKKTSSPVVIGGTTTVPSNATTVELSVSAKSATAGTLDFYPALNTAAGSGQTLTYPSGDVVATTTIEENVGQAGEVTVYNAGAATATVTVKILGYSTQVTAGDINGTGGTGGQVLTNNGTGGASWTSIPETNANTFDAGGAQSGQVLTANGSGGAIWQTPPAGAGGTAEGEYQITNNVSGPTFTLVDTLPLSQGDYHVVVTYQVSSASAVDEQCELESAGLGTYYTNHTPVNQFDTIDNAYYGTGTMQFLERNTYGGSLHLWCRTVGTGNPTSSVVDMIDAIPVASVAGSAIN